MASFYRIQLEDYLKNLDVKGKRILDIGAGDRLAKDRIKSIKFDTYHTLDINKQYNPDFQWNVNFQEYADNIFKGERYDVIFMLEVMEYVWNPVSAMFNVWDWLKNGGEAYITFPFIYPVHEPVGSDCLRYTKRGIEWLIITPWSKGFAEYEIIPRRATAGKEQLLRFFATEKMHAAKGEEHDIIGWIVHVKK